MEGLPGEADQVTRFTAEAVAARNARTGAWVFIALGAGCILFGAMFFAVKHSGHNAAAAVTHVACTDVCTADVVYDTAGGQVSAVLHGVHASDLYGPPSRRLLNISYQSGAEADPTTNDMPDALWVAFGAAGVAAAGAGAWWRRFEGSPRTLTQAGAGGADTAAFTSPPAGPAGLAATPGRGARWVDDRSGAVTIAERFPRWWAAIFTLLPAVYLGSVVGQHSRTWLARGHSLTTDACLVIAVAALTWGCSRSWRIALRLGNSGVTVRNFLRTYRISWPEVRCFADGSPASLRLYPDAAGQARRTGIMAAVWLAVTAATTPAAVMAILGARNLSKPPVGFGLAVSVACVTPALALLMASRAWAGRKNVKEIDQATWAAAEPAGTGDDPASSRAAQMRCLECGAESAEAAEVCARCGAPTSLEQPVTGRSRRKALVVAGAGAVMLAALITVIAVTSSSTSAANQLTADQLQPGDCLAGSNMGLATSSPWPGYVTRVACTKRHEAEVFFAGNIWPQSMAYPRDGTFGNQPDARCTAAFAVYDGIDWSQSAFTYAALVPGSADWASGSRSLECVAYEPSAAGPSGGTPVDYSIKGSKK